MITPDDRPVFSIVIGPPASGKSSLRRMREFRNYFFPNHLERDEMLKQAIRDNPHLDREAVNKMVEEEFQGIYNDCFTNGKSVSTENIFFYPKRIELITRARNAGFFVQGIYLFTDNVEINISRMEQRKANGEHFMEPSELRKRYPVIHRNVLDNAHLFNVLNICESRQKKGIKILAVQTPTKFINRTDTPEDLPPKARDLYDRYRPYAGLIHPPAPTGRGR